MPFSTRADMLSPHTRNHKIFYVEAQIDGFDTGDAVGRIYLTQTSVINSVEGDWLLRLPRTRRSDTTHSSTAAKSTQQRCTAMMTCGASSFEYVLGVLVESPR